MRERYGARLSIALFFVALPFAILVWRALSYVWWPSSDWALIYLRTEDVLSANSPVLGAWSRWGWSHPGPMLFWILAPFVELVGARGMLLAPLVVNFVCCVAVLVIVRRRLGTVALSLTTLSLGLLLSALGSQFLMNAWNPSISLLPFLLLLLLCWEASNGEPVYFVAALPLATFCVHSHVGFAVLVAVPMSLSLFFSIRHSGSRQWLVSSRGVGSNTLKVSAAVLAVGPWVGPAIDQFGGGTGNLADILRNVSNPTEPLAGIMRSLGVAGNQLRVWGPWNGRSEHGLDGVVESVVPIQATVIVVAMVALAVFGSSSCETRVRRGVILSLGLVVAAVISTARIQGEVYPYLVRSWWIVSFVVVTGLAGSIVHFVPSVRRAATGTTATALLVVSLVPWVGLTAGAVDDDRLTEDFSAAVVGVGRQLELSLERGRQYLLVPRDTRAFAALGPGIFAYLENQGLSVVVEGQGLEPIRYGRHRTTADPSGLYRLELYGLEDLTSAPPPSPDAVEVARWDSLSPDERRRFEDLINRRSTTSSGGSDGATRSTLSPSDERDLSDLRRREMSYVVYLTK